MVERVTGEGQHLVSDVGKSLGGINLNPARPGERSRREEVGIKSLKSTYIQL